VLGQIVKYGLIEFGGIRFFLLQCDGTHEIWVGFFIVFFRLTVPPPFFILRPFFGSGGVIPSLRAYHVLEFVPFWFKFFFEGSVPGGGRPFLGALVLVPFLSRLLGGLFGLF